MRVRAGWNTEMGRRKFDCEFEESDFPRLLAEKGIKPDTELTLTEAFWLAHFSAEIYSKATLTEHYNNTSEEGRGRAAYAEAMALHNQREVLLLGIKRRLELITQEEHDAEVTRLTGPQ